MIINNLLSYILISSLDKNKLIEQLLRTSFALKSENYLCPYVLMKKRLENQFGSSKDYF